ncbi:MAG: cyclophilin-like fold protein [Methanomassiliicoccaceae archaeon]|nr:cyclophilin-like fold protein [Methanomassiliicoccaceae archaeon]
MSNIRIRTRSGIWDAVLDDSDISNEIWLSLPFSADINMLGSQIYFPMPLESTRPKGDSVLFGKGDIAYWPEADAVSIFFGPTPLSTDERPVAAFPMKKIGHVTGDCSGMEDSGDRMRITMERSF